MEYGSAKDPSAATFSIVDEDHTLANALKFTLNQDVNYLQRYPQELQTDPPATFTVLAGFSERVSFTGYNIPHPSDNRVNIRVQTTGDRASEVLKDACQDLMFICQHVRGTFDKAVSNYKASHPRDDGMDGDGSKAGP